MSMCAKNNQLLTQQNAAHRLSPVEPLRSKLHHIETYSEQSFKLVAQNTVDCTEILPKLNTPVMSSPCDAGFCKETKKILNREDVNSEAPASSRHTHRKKRSAGRAIESRHSEEEATIMTTVDKALCNLFLKRKETCKMSRKTYISGTLLRHT